MPKQRAAKSLLSLYIVLDAIGESCKKKSEKIFKFFKSGTFFAKKRVMMLASDKKVRSTLEAPAGACGVFYWAEKAGDAIYGSAALY